MSKIPETQIDAAEVNKGVAFHENLNPKLFNDNVLRKDVRLVLLKGALAFVEFLDVPGIMVEDVIFTGSNAAYNYTPYSDLDVHIIVDFDKNMCPELAENFFNTKKSLWNQTHNAKVRGYDVEMYVEDTKNPVTANGVYSLLDDKWVHHPTPTAPQWDDSAVLVKVENLADEIETLLAGPVKKSEIEAMFDRLRRMRKAGLAAKGELSVENLAFKILRNLGILEKMYNAKRAAEDRELSLESTTKNKG